MENLIVNLNEKLILRRKNEYTKIQKLDKETNKELILISSGKIMELDQFVGFIENMLNYYNQNKKITQ